MLKLVSWIDSLPRLNSTNRRKGKSDQQRRRLDTKCKSDASTPLSKRGQDERTTTKAYKKMDFLPFTGSARSAIKAIGRRRHTEPDALQCTAPTSPVMYVSSGQDKGHVTSMNRHMMSVDGHVMSLDNHVMPTDCTLMPLGGHVMSLDGHVMSISWHPEGIEKLGAGKTVSGPFHVPALINSSAVSCSVQDMGPVDFEGPPYMTQSLCRPQIRTNPWVRPKSPRIIPALDLSRSQKKEDDENRSSAGGTTSSSNRMIDSSVFSLHNSSGYGSGASQDSSPASSIHTPDWQNLNLRCCQNSIPNGANVSKDSANLSGSRANLNGTNLNGIKRAANGANSNGRIHSVKRKSFLLKSKEDVGLQCDFTQDKCVECTEDDFMEFLERDENGNIPMIDDEQSDEYDEDVCNDQCEKRLSGLGFVLSSNVETNPEDDSITEEKNVSTSSSFSWVAVSHEKALDNISCKDTAEDGFMGMSPYLDVILSGNCSGNDAIDIIDSKNQPLSGKRSAAILNVLQSKVELLKANGDEVTKAVRTAKEEKRKRNGELRMYEEEMQFLKQLKLVISNGFEVLV